MKASELIERYNNGERDFRSANLYRANLEGADMKWADLRLANLREADMKWADMRWAYLREANLYDANLYGADLEDASLEGADLYDANLQDANLEGADLRLANLEGADLRGAILPSPTMMMLARWGNVSDELCRDLMCYDAHHHHDPEAFTKWVKGGPCPYKGAKYQRACNFQEKKELWDPRPIPSCFGLMVRLIQEKCEDSDWHER